MYDARLQLAPTQFATHAFRSTRPGLPGDRRRVRGGVLATAFLVALFHPMPAAASSESSSHEQGIVETASSLANAANSSASANSSTSANLAASVSSSAASAVATSQATQAQATAPANGGTTYLQSPYRWGFSKPQTLPELELSFDYSYLHTNLSPSKCNCFGMNGGTTQAVIPFNHYLSLAMELTGEKTGLVPSTSSGLSLVVFTAGPRLSYRSKTGLTPYVQAGFGGAHGFASIFPTSSGGLADTASSLAVSLGGGVEYTLSRHFAIRPAQINYLLTRLPNGYNNRQNNLQIESGIILRIW